MLRNFIKKNHILYIVSFSLIFTLFSATFVSALTYQQEIGVNFTFNTALNLTISADLYINNLAPGAASDSNIIDVNVLTNAINGYTLTANVGNNTTYNTRNLVHSNSNLSNTFTSIAYSATPTITTNTNLSADTWGFSYSTNNGSTWSNYNGLPLYSDTTNVATLKETTGPVSSASGDDVKFKIAAKASSAQVSGAYNNVINFNLAANVVPQYTVQFDAGDGSGTMPSQIIFRDEATMLAPNSFTPPSGFVFTGWNAAAYVSCTSYTNQESVTNIAADGGTITLYAQWVVSVCAGHENELYCKVAAMNKGTQTAANLKATITTPTSSNPATDTSNSGVYEYDASLFGVSSDASNDYPIYYYRGILDSNLDNTSSTYGSIGDGAYYPNYVKLGDTCWRIVRTTGSGGVKMIYNGLYSGGTTANSCANATSAARVTNDTFFGAYSGGDSTDYKFTPGVGYTYGGSGTTIGSAFGTNENFAVNNIKSDVKWYLEDTWFTSSNGISAYESYLEPSAGYCNDRSIYNSTSSSAEPLDESTNINTYENDGYLDDYYFGAYVRNYVYGGTRTPTLSCPRNIVDLYTTSSANDGNGQLSKAVALLTADEAVLSGDGRGSDYSSNYNRNSFLHNNNRYWTLSPSRRASGYTRHFIVTYESYLDVLLINYTGDVRPVISLIPGITPASGSGTATDPWVINAPSL